MASRQLTRQKARREYLTYTRHASAIDIKVMDAGTGEIETLCKVHIPLTAEVMLTLPRTWVKKGINARVCNGELAYIYMHPDGHVKYRCKDHRWKLKRRTSRWEEHVALWMQR